MRSRTCHRHQACIKWLDGCRLRSGAGPANSACLQLLPAASVAAHPCAPSRGAPRHTSPATRRRVDVARRADSARGGGIACAHDDHQRLCRAARRQHTRGDEPAAEVGCRLPAGLLSQEDYSQSPSAMTLTSCLAGSGRQPRWRPEWGAADLACAAGGRTQNRFCLNVTLEEPFKLGLQAGRAADEVPAASRLC